MQKFTSILVLALALSACHPPAGKDKRFMASGKVNPKQSPQAVISQKTAAPSAWEATRKRFEASIKTEQVLGEQRLTIPGGAIAVVINGQLAHAEGFGQADIETQRAFQIQDRMSIASITKMITAATVLKLVEEGRLDLDRPVNEYLKRSAQPWTFQRDNESQEWANRVTLRQALTHTAGIPDELPSGISDFGDSVCGTGPDAFQSYFALHGKDPLWAEPGAVWNYSNPGYFLAAAVVEAVTGQSFEEVTTEKVLKPAGMKTAAWDGAEVEAKGAFARGYEYGSREDGSKGLVTYGPASTPCRVYRPAAGLIANVQDLAAFAKAMMARKSPVLGPKGLKEFTGSGLPTYDLGWDYGVGAFVQKNYKGLKVIAHDGAGWGYRTVLVMVPERNFAFIAFHNVGLSFPELLWDQAFDAIDAFLGLPAGPMPVPEVPAGELEKLAGVYKGWTYDYEQYTEAAPAYALLTTSITFDPITQTLNWDDDWLGAAQLQKSYWPAFQVKYPDSSNNITVRFVPDAEGEIAYIVSRDYVGKRLQPLAACVQPSKQ